jgi:hypothetical protein
VDPARSKGSNGARVWRVELPALAPGRHEVEVQASDKAGNVTVVRKEFQALDFGAAEPPVTAGEEPTFWIEVQGGTDSADPGTAIKVTFSEPVTGISPQTFFLNKVTPGGTAFVSGVRILWTT